jgi:hypothetical protein
MYGSSPFASLGYFSRREKNVVTAVAVGSSPLARTSPLPPAARRSRRNLPPGSRGDIGRSIPPKNGGMVAA